MVEFVIKIYLLLLLGCTSFNEQQAMSLSAVSDITVDRVVKKIIPKKHFVFSIQVEWKDGLIIRIYRSHDDTRTLQKKLQETEGFTAYLSNETAEHRDAYLLPEKSWFGKLTTKTRKQARRRMVEVEEFLKSVVHLPDYISRSDVVIAFFRPVADDLLFVEPDSLKETRGSRRKDYPVHISEPILLDQYVAISDYNKIDKNDLSLKAGSIVEVIYQAEHGWWFVDLDGDLGWVPASYLESRDGDMDDQIIETFGEGKGEIYIAMVTYEPEFDDEIKLEVGRIMQVKQKKMDGWWLVKCDNGTGWVPCMYLHELSTSSTKAYAREIGREKAMVTMNNLFAIADRRTTWNPTFHPKRLSTPKSTIRRRYGREGTILEDEEKPSYMNIEFHKKNDTKNNNNEAKEAGPSYINLEFHKKENKMVNKNPKVAKENKGKEQGPSYINMQFHKNNGHAPRQRVRRRRDDDEDLVEIDFDKMKELASQSKENPSKPRLVENGIQKETESDKREKEDIPSDKVGESSDSEVDYETPLPVNGTGKPLKTDGPRKESEKKTSKGTSLEVSSLEVPRDKDVKISPKCDLKIVLPDPTDEPTDTTSGIKIFLAIGDYSKESDREVNLQTGASVEVMEQTEGGWWLVRTQSLSIGWAPSNFLQKISHEELDKRMELGLEPPGKPPQRPPKSPMVHRMALHVSTEQRFWNFMRKNDPNNVTCSIVDEKQVCRVSDGCEKKPMLMDINGNQIMGQ